MISSDQDALDDRAGGTFYCSIARCHLHRHIGKAWVDFYAHNTRSFKLHSMFGYLQGLGRSFIAIYLRKRQRYANTTKPGPYSMNVNSLLARLL